MKPSFLASFLGLQFALLSFNAYASGSPAIVFYMIGLILFQFTMVFLSVRKRGKGFDKNARLFIIIYCVMLMGLWDYFLQLKDSSNLVVSGLLLVIPSIFVMIFVNLDKK